MKETNTLELTSEEISRISGALLLVMADKTIEGNMEEEAVWEDLYFKVHSLVMPQGDE